MDVVVEARTDGPGTEDVLEGVPRTVITTGKVYIVPAAFEAVTVTVTVLPTAAAGAITLRISSFVPERVAQTKLVLITTSVSLLR